MKKAAVFAVLFLALTALGASAQIVEFSEVDPGNLTLLDGTGLYVPYGLEFEDETYYAIDLRFVGAGTDDRGITTSGGANNIMTIVFLETPTYVRLDWVTLGSNDITATAYDAGGGVLDSQASAGLIDPVNLGFFEFSNIGTISRITLNDGTGTIGVGRIEFLTTSSIPTLSPIGATMLVALIAGLGVFVVSRIRHG